MKLGISALVRGIVMVAALGVANFVSAQDGPQEFHEGTELLQARLVSPADYKERFPDVPKFLCPKNPKGPYLMELPDGYVEPPIPNSGATLDINAGIEPLANPITIPVGVDSLAWNDYTPPDNVMAADETHAVVVTNDDFRIYDRDGNTVATYDINSFLNDGRMIFDPRIYFDRMTGRWFMTWDLLQYTAPDYNGATTEVVIMISRTGDVTGDWWVYYVGVKDNDGTTTRRHWMDYPHVGFNRDAVIVTGRMFPFSGSGGTGSYDKVYFFQKSAMMAGGSASFWWYTGLSSASAADVNSVPAQMKSQPVNSGNGEDEAYVLAAKWYATNTITLFRYSTQDTGYPTLLNTHVITVDTYTPPPGIRQTGYQEIENVAPRLMNVVYYAGNIWTGHSSQYDWGSGNINAALKLYRFTNANPPVVTWDNYFGAGALDYAYPSISAGTNYDAYVGFARGGPAEYCGIRSIARQDADTGWNGSFNLKAGEAWYSRLYDGRNRWGDYFGSSTDEYDQKSYWVYGEYADAGNNFGTWVSRASYKPFANVVADNKTGEITTAVSLTASVTDSSTSGAVSGISVLFSIDGSYIGSATTNASGVATLAYTIPFVLPGSSTISTRVDENYTYLGSSDTAVLTRTKHTPYITVYDRNIQYAQDAQLHAWLRRTDGVAIASATVAFSVGGTNVGSGVTDTYGDAWLTWLAGYTPGTYTIVASYAGNSYFNAVNDSATLVESLATTSMVVNDATGVVGESVNLIATLRRVHDNWLMGPGYTVAFTVGGVAVGSDTTDAAGQASLAWTVTNATLGPTPLVASFAGTSLHAASSATGTLTRYARTTVTVSAASGQRLTTVTLQATLTMTITGTGLSGGTINFTIDGTAVGSAVTNVGGFAGLPYSIPLGLTVGTHTIGASFSATGFYLGSSGSNTLTVTRFVTSVTGSNITGTAGQVLTCSATLRRTVDNAGISGKTVRFLVDSATIGTGVTNASGVASYNWTVPIGILGGRPYECRFDGDTDYDPATWTGLFTRNGKLLAGVVTLLDYTVPPTGLIATVNVYDSANILRESFNVTLTASGSWSHSNSPVSTGTHRVEIKVWHWLNKAMTYTFTTAGRSGMTHSLINGDVDQDNEVGPGDFGMLSYAFGSVSGDSNWISAADLDGDGEVGPSDFGILSSNFGTSGD